MPEYKIKVRKSLGWKSAEKGLISISQGQECHEGDKLDALLAWGIAEHAHCILNISDTLHRHNLIRQGAAPKEALRESQRLGDEWMLRNGETLQKYNSGFYRIHRWNDWLYHGDFSNLNHRVRDFYEYNDAFRAAAQADVNDFIGRKEPEDGVGPDRAFESSLDYLLEETAAYIIMSRMYRANRIYPGKPLRTFEHLRITPDIPLQLRGMEMSLCVHVTFKRTRDGETDRQAA